MASQTPQNMSTYLGWPLMMIWMSFKNHEKSCFLPYFALFYLMGPIRQNRAKNMIFHDFLKLVQIIIKCHLRYVDMFWGVWEAISGPWSHFKAFPTIWSAISWKIKNIQKCPKSRFSPKIQNFSKSIRLIINLWPIYGRKYVFGVP